MLFVIPVKAFDAAKARLAGHLSDRERRVLARSAATHVARTCRSTGADVAVITADKTVAEWAREEGCHVVEDPRRGLDEAVAAGVAAAGGAPWCVVHGDLPLLDRTDLIRVLDAAGPGTAVLAPSRDGGTNILSAAEPIRFAYGPGSFTRHLRAASHLERCIVATTGTILDIDSPDDLARAAALTAGAWLRPYLGSTP